MTLRGRWRLVGAAVVGMLSGSLVLAQPASETVPLSKVSHVHGISVDRTDPSRLFLATHYGLYLASPDGTARRVSTAGDDFMGVTPHPSDPTVFYASGHPAGGGNLGFIVSNDGGATWSQLSKGVRGPVDFHQMDVSKADPSVIYGVFGGVQVSRDGGKTWQMAGPAPEGLIAIAAGAKSQDTVYAATKTGLEVSRDGGRTWQPAHMLRRPVTTVHVSADGTVYAYMLGTGLIKGREGDMSWATLGRLDGDAVMLHLAAAPDRLYAVTQANDVLASRDGGATWSPFASGGGQGARRS